MTCPASFGERAEGAKPKVGPPTPHVRSWVVGGHDVGDCFLWSHGSSVASAWRTVRLSNPGIIRGCREYGLDSRLTSGSSIGRHRDSRNADLPARYRCIGSVPVSTLKGSETSLAASLVRGTDPLLGRIDPRLSGNRHSNRPYRGRVAQAPLPSGSGELVRVRRLP